MSRSLKKIITGTFVFVLALGISFVAYAQEFSFTNELSSGIVSIDNIFEEETSFAGITENAALEFSSEKVDAYLEIEFTLGTGTGNETSDTKNINFAVTGLDYYLDVRPFSFLTLALHDNLWKEAPATAKMKNSILGLELTTLLEIGFRLEQKPEISLIPKNTL